MRVLAAALALAAWSCVARAHDAPATRVLPSLLTLLGISKQSPVHNIITCSQTLGPSKCLSALGVYRAENALASLENDEEIQSNVIGDVKQFPWKQYSNTSDEQLHSELCDGAEKLLRYRSLKLSMIPGYTVELESKGNGTLNVDLLKNSEFTGRGTMKKLQKQFYNILPLLMVPGLIMSAILPFVLPALKMMTIGAVMINNMALTGAVFTLLRNNAFSDNYEHKVVYVNEGYKNEKVSPAYYKDIPLENVEVSASDLHSIVEGQPGEAFIVEEYPTNEQWMSQYYGNAGAVKTRRSSQRKQYVKVKHH